MTDRIFLRELKAEVIIGIFDWERKVKQTVAFDLEIPFDIRAAAHSDRIDDTINYKSLAKRILAYAESSEFHLVETLAEKVAELVLTDFKVEWVDLTLNKPGAVRGSRDVGVRILRRRADLEAGGASG